MADGENEKSGEVTISWCNDIGTRDGTLTADSKMVNCFVEKTASGVALIKRPGSKYVSGITGTAQGQFSYFGTNYFIVNNTAYVAGTTSGGGIAIPGSTGTLAFWSVDAQQVGAPQTAVQDEAGSLWVFNGSVFTTVTDANYTSTSVAPGLAYLDGVYYAMRVDGQLIGSAINNPATWPALDFVQADVTYGAGISVLRHLNYIIGFYDQGTQVFWDANAAPNGSGIALQPVLSASYRTGCFNARTISNLGDTAFFVSHSKQFGRQVQMMNGLQMQVVSTPFIEKILSNTALVQDSSQMWAFSIRISGHSFYVLTLSTLNLTLVYDVEGRVWNTWSSVVGGVEQYFVGRFYIESQGQEAIYGDVLLDVSTGKQINMLPTLYTDATGPIPVTSVTPPYDWGTMDYKRFDVMYQFSDTANTIVNISYSDDDYQTFSTPRQVSLAGARKQMRNCGSSRRRIWKLTHQDNTPLRLFDLKSPTDVSTR